MAAEIPAHHAGDAGSAHCGLHPPNHHGLQRPLAHCRQVSLVSGTPGVGMNFISASCLIASVLIPAPFILQAAEPAVCCSPGRACRIWAL